MPLTLTHFDTPLIKYKDNTLNQQAKLLQIGYFAIPAEPADFYSKKPIPDEVTEQVYVILQNNNELNWIISESYSGLYLDIVKSPNVATFSYTLEVGMFVYISPENYTFCQLKYHNNLTDMAT